MSFNILGKYFSKKMKIDFKMTNYPGMTLNNEVRESVSLDEDDLSDVEDEVFIRDGKNSYKTAEEIYVKRPLMAPRRKIARNNISIRMKNKPPCKAFCKPCCYFLGALSVIIGLIILVIILVSIFPLPLNRIHDWILSKFATKDPFESYIKLLPCSDYKITDVWTTTLPKVTTDSPIRLLDINNDQIEDAIFGFGTGDNYGILPNDIFCSAFMGVSPPCEGGVIALNGMTGDILWRFWTNDTIYLIHCSEDVNKDGLNDCLAMGTKGTITLINSRYGTSLWVHYGNRDEILIGSFISDQNNDTVADILASHTDLSETDGHIIVLSGKNGNVIKKIPVGARTFYMPQIIHKNDGDYILFGSGGPTTPGNLSIAELKTFLLNTSNSYDNRKTIFRDNYSGVIIQSILVDITGDEIPDIITAMYNSTVVAFDGKNNSQIWNFTVEKSQTNLVPIPGFFNFDNVTDFLITYETYDNILKYNYTQTYILNGANGKPIYEKPISDSIRSQIGDISLSMESYGYDMFMFWTSECKSTDIFKNIDFPLKGVNVYPLFETCHNLENTTTILKLNILNQFDQPPGVEIYNSFNRTLLEFNGTKTPMQIIREYFNHHPNAYLRMHGQLEIDEGYDNNNSERIGIHKYGKSNFRHKDSRQGLLKKFPPSDHYVNYQDVPEHRKSYNSYYETEANVPDDLDDYNTDDELTKKEKHLVMKTPGLLSNRDPRSKSEIVEETIEGSAVGMDSPMDNREEDQDEILSDTYYKNLENRLRTSKFEQRDLSSHRNKKSEEESINKVLEEQKRAQQNMSYNLWNLESEKEEEDRRNNYWRGSRKKRQLNLASYGNFKRMTSVGAVTEAFKVSNDSNSIDVIFLTYWQPINYKPRENLEEELAECVEENYQHKETLINIRKLRTQKKGHCSSTSAFLSRATLSVNSCTLTTSTN
ncbi:hypothetical protein WA026_013695 [Henosepilachna vigintioctopunctata]|uniref:FAM234A/B beta-propeller domain-containing protein n=1 Tax=Henosepilachna vigintioctopunctata TaxID=420089 RepID=A0AAW1UXM3_9CUCU